jgi:hypothetical protein
MRTRVLALLLAVPALAAADAPDAPRLELREVAKTVTEALAGADPAKASPGEARRLAWVAKTEDPKKAIEELRSALEAEKLTVVDAPGATPEEAALTVEGGSGARAIIQLGLSTGAIYLVAKPSAAKAPGTCSAIPEREARITVHASGTNQHGEHHSSEIYWRLSTSRLLDIDGDGILDAFVPRYSEGQCPDEVFWEVYLVRGGCGHSLGEVGPGLLSNDATVPLDASGFRPLTLGSSSTSAGARGIPVKTDVKIRFSVKKGAYTRTKGEKSGGKCHHCARTWCSATP